MVQKKSEGHKLFAKLVWALSLCVSLCFGQAATLEWDRNPETNVIGYRVYVGRVSRLYDSVLDIGNQITTQVPTSPGTTYFAVTAYDSDGLESDYSEEVFYTVTAGNTAPSALADNYIAAGNTTLNVSAALGVLANDSDADGNALTAAWSSGPSHGTVTLNSDGSFSYSPTIGFVGADSFTYQASDGIAASEVTIVNLTVNTPVNRFPISQADTYATLKNVPLSINAVAGVLANDADPDGDVFMAYLQAPPLHGDVTLSLDGSFLYTPAPGFSGVDSFTYLAFDGLDTSPDTLVTIVVTGPANSAPVAQADTYATVKNTPLNVAVSLGVLANDSDIDSDPLTAALANAPGHGSVTLNANGSFVYTPNTSYTGTDTFRYRANDGIANSATVVVTITITPAPNAVPVAANDNYSMAKNTTLTISGAGGVLANDTDADDSNLTALLVVSPTHGTLTLNANGGFNYTPTAGYNGTDSFGYRARDGATNSATATVIITIQNNVPVARVNAYTVTKNTTLNVNAASGVLANDTDSDGDTLTAALVNPPANGTLSLNSNGSFLYTPASGYSGSDSFVYRAIDGSAASSATVTITITEQPGSTNSAPNAEPENYYTSKNVQLNVPATSGVLLNDSDAEDHPLTAVLLISTVHGILVFNPNGGFVYTPNPDFTGTDSFVYQASDGTSGSPTRRVTIEVLADLPTACTTCFAQLDEVLAARSNAFAAVITARRSVPTNATCPKYHVLVFQTLSRSLAPFHDTAADQALSLAADCVVSEWQDELNARQAYTATLAPSKFTIQAANYINVARQNLALVHGAADNSTRAKYFAAAASALLRVEKAIASGDLAPASLVGKSLACLLTDGGRPFEATFSFGNGSFVFADAAGAPLGAGTYSFTRTTYNGASLNLQFDTYAPGESTSFVMKFSRARNRMTGSKIRGYFTVE